MTNKNLSNLAEQYSDGQVFAYPTEAVFGLGCDPQNKAAVDTILQLKSRDVKKGVILIASTFAQIAPYVLFDDLPSSTQAAIMQSWPGPVTWLLPKSAYTPSWISGNSELVAVRITAHPLVRAMCNEVNQPFVSTSANPAGAEPAKTIAQLHTYFGDALNANMLTLIEGELGKQTAPSKIFNSLTMETIRA